MERPELSDPTGMRGGAKATGSYPAHPPIGRLSAQRQSREKAHDAAAQEMRPRSTGGLLGMDRRWC